LRSEAARRGIKRGDVIILLIQNGGGQLAFVALPIE
jgi:hypothetical protein